MALIMQPDTFPWWFALLMSCIGLAVISLLAWGGLAMLRWIGRSLWPESHAGDPLDPGA